jgi:hypothetical protein
VKHNPPWANRLIAKNWSRISEVGNQSWMPRETDASTPRKRSFAELGCGHYGCVFATSEPGIVFKISTDPSEVEFVKAAMQIGDWPNGIVRYHAILDIKGAHRKRPAFVVWREEAFDVGNVTRPTDLPGGLGDDPRARAEWMRYHKAYRFAATYVRDTSLKPTWGKRLKEARSYERWAWNNVIWEDGLPNEILGQHPTFTRYRTAQRLAAALRICHITFELMEHTNFAPDVGAALGFYLDHGILLADVHMNNVGHVTRRDDYGEHELIVITDPGHAVFLRNA